MLVTLCVSGDSNETRRQGKRCPIHYCVYVLLCLYVTLCEFGDLHEMKNGGKHIPLLVCSLRWVWTPLGIFALAPTKYHEGSGDHAVHICIYAFVRLYGRYTSNAVPNDTSSNAKLIVC